MLDNDKNLITRVIEYALSKNDFTYDEMSREMKLNEQEDFFVRSVLLGKDLNGNHSPNNLLGISEQTHNTPNSPFINFGKSKYRLLPTAYFSYVDLLEIKEARRSAKQAYKLSIAAIILSILIGAVQIVLQVLQSPK